MKGQGHRPEGATCHLCGRSGTRAFITINDRDQCEGGDACRRRQERGQITGQGALWTVAEIIALMESAAESEPEHKLGD